MIIPGLTASEAAPKPGAGPDFGAILQNSLFNQDRQKPLEMATIELLCRTLEIILSESESNGSFLSNGSYLPSLPLPAFSSFNWPTLSLQQQDSRNFTHARGVQQPGRAEEQLPLLAEPEITKADIKDTGLLRTLEEQGVYEEHGSPAPGGRMAASGDHDIEGIVRESANKYNLDPALIRAIIAVESNGDPKAVSPAGAQGLMQLMPGTAAEMGVTDPFDPVQNIMGGAAYLRRLLDRYQGNVRLALAAYNWGMGNLESRAGSMPKETRDYITRVEEAYYRA